jgi:UDP-N-acetyl-D-glucosamine dehydrogenase
MTYDLAVVGLGYVGLPLAQEAVRRGLSVRGLDASTRVVEGLNAGRSHIDDLDDDAIAAMTAGGFVASTDEAILADADAIVICVPTPLSAEGGPDLGAVNSAVASVARQLRAGQLIVLESTTYPGTTEEVVRPALEAGGLRVGTDINLAFSPERIDPGNATYGVANTPKVVGGCTPQCTERARAMYARFIDSVVTTRGTREAEMAKLLENTYRHVNIALVNEMARFCHELDIDLWDVIDAASTKPFGFQPFRPGPGVGGHCIPIDPNYLAHQVKERLGYPFRFVELAQEINVGMPAYVVARVRSALTAQGRDLDGATVLLLGVTYKADIADERESPARPLAQLLLDAGAKVQFHDPSVAVWNLDATTLDRVDDLDAALVEADVAVLLQAHRDYDAASMARAASLFFDTRGVVRDGSAQTL